MTNPVSQIVQYEGTDWKKFLENMCLYDIFKEVIEEYGNDILTLRGIIRYIVWAYSIQSEKVLLGIEWRKNKQNIFEAAELPDDRWAEIGELKNNSILSCVKRWIEFQDSEVYIDLMTLKELRQQMQSAAISDIRKSTGEIDYDAKFKCAEYTGNLTNMIKDVEANLLQNNIHLKDAVKEVRTARIKQTMSVESFAK